MITTKSTGPCYPLQFTNGTHMATADAPKDKGGGGTGFGAHELLEASLASCINMWVRMEANRLGIQAGQVAVSVQLHRDHPQEATFDYTVELDSSLSDAHRATLLAASDNCPVRRTLMKMLSFRRVGRENSGQNNKTP